MLFLLPYSESFHEEVYTFEDKFLSLAFFTESAKKKEKEAGKMYAVKSFIATCSWGFQPLG